MESLKSTTGLCEIIKPSGEKPSQYNYRTKGIRVEELKSSNKDFPGLAAQYVLLTFLQPVHQDHFAQLKLDWDIKIPSVAREEHEMV